MAPPPRGRSTAYGGYIVSYQDCRLYHGGDLEGSLGRLLPCAPNARAFARGWTEEQFIQTLRTGIDPSGEPIEPPMHWEMVGRMDDPDLAAIYAYLRGAE